MNVRIGSSSATILCVSKNLVTMASKIFPQAMEYARKLRDDRGKGNIVVVEDGEENADEMGADEFEVSV